MKCSLVITRTIWASLSLLFLLSSRPVKAEEYLVKEGQPRAEIVISKEPERSVRLAAADLQTYLEKITGARLPIVREPGSASMKVYVGRSAATDALNISAEALDAGAYRIVSGRNWLVLIGQDTDFEPIEPWGRGNNDRVSGKLQAEWDAITGDFWGVPNAGMYKNQLRLPGGLGLPADESAAAEAKKETFTIWGFDERGSFNAVCGFLRHLGVRWYLPGEIGEVVPKRDSIPLPSIDEIVHPDFPVRRFNFRFSTSGPETAFWAMHLGVRDPFGLQVAHGMDTMTHRDEIFDLHPEWFALYGGKRQTQKGERLNQLCYSNEELFEATVRNARIQLDHYHFDTVSIMPPDGYTSICQCPLCKGKDTPERDYRGRLSDHVWDFVNRVAKEVGKTHPDQKVLCCAYGSYTLPPLKIDRLEPNVQVCIVGGRRPKSPPEEREAIRQLREDWLAKTQNPILIFENYPFTDRGWYLPAFQPHVIGEGINATKGVSQGEDIWLSAGRDFATDGIGFNHFMVYFTARNYWGGKDQDPDALFREYCETFYGPGGEPMRAFFEYCEANWHLMEKDVEKLQHTFELFDAAKTAVDPGSVYARRLALIDDFLTALRNKGEQLSQQRGPVPAFRLAKNASGIVIDGKLDDEFWRTCPSHANGRLRELQTGRLPVYSTTFQGAWGERGDLYFAIRCQDQPGELLHIGTRENQDLALWMGDAIEVLLETDSHSYYQIAVNPAGAVTCLDRGASKAAWMNWDAQAEVATHMADGEWIVEMRIPVVEDENDPLHQVAGRQPSTSLPWFFNLCRQRLRDNGAEHSAFSPTGTANFHEVSKFAHLYEGQSFKFDHAEPEPGDFLNALRATEDLKPAESIEALVALSGSPGLTGLQKSEVLSRAARLARSQKDLDRAEQLAAAIPLEPVAKTVRMQNLSAQRDFQEVVDEFQNEDIASTWPFWIQGEALTARGRAFSATGAGEKAEADLLRAAPLTPDLREWQGVWRSTGNNRETVLKDTAAALAAYQTVADSTQGTGSSEYYYCVQGAARVLREAGQFAEALAMLHRVDAGKLRGTWRGSFLLAQAETQAAAGRREQALEIYRGIASDDQVLERDQQTAREALASLERR